jgi:hypothetical protein
MAYNPDLKEAGKALPDNGNITATLETVKIEALPKLPLKNANCNGYGNG